MNIELYDLESDVSEQNDVADQYPEIVSRLNDIMKIEHQPSTNQKFQFAQLGDK